MIYAVKVSAGNVMGEVLPITFYPYQPSISKGDTAPLKVFSAASSAVIVLSFMYVVFPTTLPLSHPGVDHNTW